VSRWLDATRGQLTHYGLAQLHSSLAENELAVLFRNNHFSCVTKHSGRLYALVTDEGVVGAAPCAAWNALWDISGDDTLMDEEFRVVTPEMIAASVVQRQNSAPLPAAPPAAAAPAGPPLQRSHSDPVAARPQHMYNAPAGSNLAASAPAHGSAASAAGSAAAPPAAVPSGYAVLSESLAVAVPAGMDPTAYQQQVLYEQELALQQATARKLEREKLERREYERLSNLHRKRKEAAERKKEKKDSCRIM
jgi:hypothetical protein